MIVCAYTNLDDGTIIFVSPQALSWIIQQHIKSKGHQQTANLTAIKIDFASPATHACSRFSQQFSLILYYILLGGCFVFVFFSPDHYNNAHVNHV